MVLTRQNVPTITDNPPVKHGAYVLHETGDEISAVVIATGSEVSLALAAAQELANDKISIRVVSAPCLEWFDEQTTKYQESVLGIDIPRVSVEAGSTLGWHRYIGGMGTTIGVNNFGASATPDYLFELNGVTVANIVKSVKDLLKA
jgi:transketolase